MPVSLPTSTLFTVLRIIETATWRPHRGVSVAFPPKGAARRGPRTPRAQKAHNESSSAEMQHPMLHLVTISAKLSLPLDTLFVGVGI